MLDGKVIGSGIESGRSTGDITNHAEILAVRDAINKGFTGNLASAAMYTTHEPGIMCSYVIRHHKIPKLIYGVSVPLVGGDTSPFGVIKTEDNPNWGTGPQIISGVCSVECEELNKEFLASQNK